MPLDRTVVVIALLAAAAPALAQTRPREDRSLEAAIEALEAAGLAIFYSSDLVTPAMTLQDEPRSSDPRERLREILRPFGLTTRPGPRGSVLVVRAAQPSSAGASGGVRPLVEAPRPEPPPQIEEIVVAASQYELGRDIDAAIRLTGGDIEDLPDLGDDALRAVHRLPGAASDGFSARAHVRGGETGDTLVRFDGIRLYDPFHLESFAGVFSAIDPRVVSSIDVHTGAFAATFGDRLGGVIDVTSLAPPEDRYHEIGVSFFNASLLSAGRFDGGDGEWLASVRRSNLDLLYNAFSRHPERPRYTDALGRIRHRLGDTLALTVGSLYLHDDVTLLDDFDSEERASSDGEDRYAWVTLDHALGNAIGSTSIARAMLVHDRFGVTDKDGLSAGLLAEHRDLRVDTLQSDWSWRRGERWLVRFGGALGRSRGLYDYRDAVEFALLFAAPGAPTEPARERALRVAPRGHQKSAYASLRYRPTERATADFGMRFDRQSLAPNERGTLDPRLGLRYRIAERTYVRAGWGRFHQSQSIDELQVSDGVTTFFAPQRADQAVVGLEHELTDGVLLRIDAYERRLTHVKPRYENLLSSLTLLPELKPDRVRVAPTAARARGIELFVMHRPPAGVGWWASYSRSSADDRIDGADVPRSWEQSDSVSGGFDWHNASWTVALALAYRSGWPTTAALALDDDAPLPVVITGPRNAERVDFYRSTDLRVSRDVDVGRGKLVAFLEVNNLFGRTNRCCSEYQLEADDSAEPFFELGPINYPPLIPSLGFVWSF
jgi:hypothetical protein